MQVTQAGNGFYRGTRPVVMKRYHTVLALLRSRFSVLGPSTPDVERRKHHLLFDHDLPPYHVIQYTGDIMLKDAWPKSGSIMMCESLEGETVKTPCMSRVDKSWHFGCFVLPIRGVRLCPEALSFRKPE